MDRILQFSIDGCPSTVALAVNKVEFFAKQCKIRQSERRQIYIIVEEILSNIILHAYANYQKDKSIHICCRVKHNSVIEFQISDNGNPISFLDDTSSLSLKEVMQSSLIQHVGYGLKLVYQLTDSVYFYRDEFGVNHTRIIKSISPLEEVRN